MRLADPEGGPRIGPDRAPRTPRRRLRGGNSGGRAKMAAKKAAKKGGKGNGGGGNLVVGSKVKEAIRSSGVRMAGDLLDALNSSVNTMIRGAVSRAKANNRGTVRPQDL